MWTIFNVFFMLNFYTLKQMSRNQHFNVYEIEMCTFFLSSAVLCKGCGYLRQWRPWPGDICRDSFEWEDQVWLRFLAVWNSRFLSVCLYPLMASLRAECLETRSHLRNKEISTLKSLFYSIWREVGLSPINSWLVK